MPQPQRWHASRLDRGDHLFGSFQAHLETYRFAKFKSWAATPDKCTFKVSKDEGKHTLTKEAVEFGTDMVSQPGRSSLGYGAMGRRCATMK